MAWPAGRSSAPLLIARGLTESLAGRFEVLQVPHWSYPEMRDAFGFTLDNYVSFGGYPGAAGLVKDHDRWRRYILDSLIETTISRDVLLLTRVDKPALLRRLFDLACDYSGQILSYTKMLGQLQDAGNTTTLAHYLDLLSQAGMVTGLQKYSGSAVRKRSSSPKLQVLNTALMSAVSGLAPAEAVADPTHCGRLVESTVGAHLANAAATGECELLYWRDGNYEVDFVLRVGRTTVAIEVKSGSRSPHPTPPSAVSPPHRRVVVVLPLFVCYRFVTRSPRRPSRVKTQRRVPVMSPIRRRLIAVDAQNLLGCHPADASAACWEFAITESLNAVGFREDTDHLVIAVAPDWAFTVKALAPFARLIVRGGRHGADLALCTALEDTNFIASRYSEVVIASGSHIFRRSVRALADAGVPTTVACLPHQTSSALTATAAHVTWLDRPCAVPVRTRLGLAA